MKYRFFPLASYTLKFSGYNKIVKKSLHIEKEILLLQILICNISVTYIARLDCFFDMMTHTYKSTAMVYFIHYFVS